MTQHDNELDRYDAYGSAVPNVPQPDRDPHEIIEAHRLLLDAAEVENEQLRTENATLRAWCVEQILKTNPRREH